MYLLYVCYFVQFFLLAQPLHALVDAFLLLVVLAAMVSTSLNFFPRNFVPLA